MFLGYNTNGLAHHAPLDALALLAGVGYRGVGLTVDHGLLNPFSPDIAQQRRQMAAALARHGLRSVVETGARFLLDPRRKHEPTLLSASPALRQKRIEFLSACIDLAAELGSDCVSLWSGILREPLPFAEALDRLTAGLETVLKHAEQRQVVLAFEPEPGMLIDTMSRYDQLAARFPSPWFRLTLDIGHLHCQGETPLAQFIARYAGCLANVHLEDMRRGVHEHLLFGEGEIDFPPVLEALAQSGYAGGIYVELSRHSHLAPAAVQQSYDFLTSIWPALRGL